MGTLHHIVLAGLVAAEEAGHGGGITEQLGIRVELIGAQIIGFLLLLALLKVFAYRPIMDVLDQREEEIRTRYSDADKARDHAEELRKSYEQRMAQADVEVRDKIQDGIREGQAARAQIVAQAHSERERIVQQGQREVAEEREKMVYAVRESVVNMAVEAAGKIISRSMDADTHRALVDEFLAEIPTGTAGEAKS